MDNREWDGWMASPTQWTWAWASSGSWWWTGNPSVLQSKGSQRVGHDWATELTELNYNWPSFDPWVGKIPWRRKWQPTWVFLHGQSHEQGSLVAYSPCGPKESDMTEQEHGWHRITTEDEHFVFLVLLRLPIYIFCPLDLIFLTDL